MSVFITGGTSGGGTVNIPELTSDPVSPTPQSAWVLNQGTAGGSPIGLLLSLTYAGQIGPYSFSYRTLENTTIRVILT